MANTNAELHRRALFLPIVVLCFLSPFASSDLAADRAECTEKLIGLSTCLAYVGGSGQLPTPDCCAGFKQVVTQSMKCLCTLIKDRNEPDLGLQIDVPRALTIPPKCHVPTNVSQCPQLLNLPPNSASAKEFYQYEKQLEGGSPNANATVNPVEKGNTSNVPSHVSKKSWLGAEISAKTWIIPPFLVLFSILVLGL